MSKQRYRPKTLSLSNTWVRSIADMETRAETILEAIASPERRVSLDWYVEDWTDFLGLDLSDKVRVEMPTISSDAFVEGIALDLPLAQVNIRATMDLSLVESIPTPVVPPAPMAAWDQFKALTGALGIQFEAGVNFVDLYENNPAARARSRTRRRGSSRTTRYSGLSGSGGSQAAIRSRFTEAGRRCTPVHTSAGLPMRGRCTSSTRMTTNTLRSARTA